MKDLTTNLLKKVKASIHLRDTDSEAYVESFRQAETFITATINNNLEFVPLQLLFLRYNKYQILLEVKAVFGDGVEHPQLDDLLIKFYNDHELKRDIDSISDSVKYHIKPLASRSTSDDGLFQWDELSRLASYAATNYRASDDQLKQVGQDFAEYIMHPTNSWGEAILPNGYILENERYWQVAGKFKSFTWAKIKHHNHTEKHVFFSVGVDIEASQLIFKLDCLRSGTHKLSNFDIRKFDYFTENFNCITKIDQSLAQAVGWDTILTLSAAFIEEFESVYLGVVNYIWSSKIDLSQFRSKVFGVKAEDVKPTGNVGEPLPELLYNIVLDNIVRYEQYMLSHAEKPDLAALVKFSFGSLWQIESFEFDGQHKRIYVVANTGNFTTPFEISEELRNTLAEDDHTYIYQVYDYDEATGCGKLIMRKGELKQFAKLKSIKYLATIK